jgi:UDP-N-acetylmuramoyl-tripeptide--D-alanyl-D-alanine ligase
MLPVPLESLIAACAGVTQGIRDRHAHCSRIETDSRRVKPGDVFWAIAGRQDDGHRYVAEAVQRGAIACVVEPHRCDQDRFPLIVVEDTILALWDFAEWYRKQSDALVLGVTGTVGKSTTRRMLHRMLSVKYRGVESPHNFNNYLGVPLSVLQLHPEHEFAALELAASNIGEIEDLASIVHPEIGIVTAVTPVHLEQFGSLENIVQAKGELIEAVPPEGFAVLNGDDDLVRQIADRARCQVILVGERSDNDIVADWVKTNHGKLRFAVDGHPFEVPVVGRHFITSALIAVAVGRQLDLTDEEIAAGLRQFEPLAGRSQFKRIGPWIVIDDTYNSSPAALKAACETLRDWQTGARKILVTGDMLELGGAAEQLHAELGQLVPACGIQRLITVGPQAATIAQMARQHGMDAGCLGTCADFETVQLLLDCWLEPGDVVLVKGSRATHMEYVLEQLEQLAAQRQSAIRRAA